MTDEQRGERPGASLPILGRIAAALGAISGVTSAVVDLLYPFSWLETLPTATVGVVLGLAGFFLGARKSGMAAFLLSAAAIILADVLED